MRLSRLTLALLVPLAGLTVALATVPTRVVAEEEDEALTEEELAELRRVAAAALQKAVKRGSELFHSKSLGRKACANCHEDPDKPQDDLSEVEWSYPAYSRRRQAVVTLQQKINEMIKYKARGKPLAHDSEDLGAIAAYLMSLKK